MTRREVTNIAASIRQRLLNLARTNQRPFGAVLQRFAVERFLYRLSVSPHRDRFVLKGALLFVVWRAPFTRPTMDIDLLGKMRNRAGAVADIVRSLCRQSAPADGLTFDADSVAGEPILAAAEYEGVRVRFRGALGKASFVMQVDVGFGDAVVGISRARFPVLIDLPEPRLATYSRESTIAEKLEAMVRRGALNSRMKDFFDVWLLAQNFDFDGGKVGQAIARTFVRRVTPIPAQPIALTQQFAESPDKQAQWRAFLRRLGGTTRAATLDQVVRDLGSFLLPVLDRLARGERLVSTWPAGGPWSA